MNKKKKIILVLLIILIVGMLFTLFINVHIINSTKNQIVDLEEINEIEDIDAIIVLGCRIHENSIPSLMLANRLERGIDVYDKLKIPIILSGDNTRDDYNEVSVMNEYVKTSIPEEDIILDNAGISTYDSVYRAKYLFNARKVVIVTQKFHIYRALYLANKLDLEAIGVVANDIPQKFIMFKNEVREILSRDKNYIKALIKPKSKYLEKSISIS